MELPPDLGVGVDLDVPQGVDTRSDQHIGHGRVRKAQPGPDPWDLVASRRLS